MNNQSPHDEWMAKIVARASGDLSPSESTMLDKHLRVCPACMQVMEDFALLAGQLYPIKRWPSQSELPPAMVALKEEIAQMIAEEDEHRTQEEIEIIINESFA